MCTVLVVEDDPDMRELERTVLDHIGFGVVTANNGREGLQTLERSRPCVILLDLMMPVMDGLSFLAERKRRHLAEEVPVVCISAAGHEMTARALRLGATECIHKPADFDQVCERVAHYCHSRSD